MADTGAPWNLPYPLPTDLVRDGADAIKDLAEATATSLSSVPQVVRQIVRATDTTNRATTSPSFVDVTGMSVSITPTSADSLIIVQAYVLATASGNSPGFSNDGYFQLADASNTPLEGAEDARFGTSLEQVMTSRHYLALSAQVAAVDTSARAYKLRFRIHGTGGRTTQARNADTTGQMYAIEVAP